MLLCVFFCVVVSCEVTRKFQSCNRNTWRCGRWLCPFSCCCWWMVILFVSRPPPLVFHFASFFCRLTPRLNHGNLIARVLVSLCVSCVCATFLFFVFLPLTLPMPSRLLLLLPPPPLQRFVLVRFCCCTSSFAGEEARRGVRGGGRAERRGRDVRAPG